MPFDPIKEERKKHKFYKNNPFFLQMKVIYYYMAIRVNLDS